MSRRPSPLRFFLLVAVLSVPFAWLGFATDRALFAGIPISALAFVCPALAACMLRYHEAGRPGLRALLRRAGDLGRAGSAGRLLPVLLMPAVTSVAYAASGDRSPGPSAMVSAAERAAAVSAVHPGGAG